MIFSPCNPNIGNRRSELDGDVVFIGLFIGGRINDLVYGYLHNYSISVCYSLRYVIIRVVLLVYDKFSRYIIPFVSSELILI